MTDSPPPEAPWPETATTGRLDSWKEIAGYLRRDISTVQRWEKREGMPVHRHVHDKLGSVYAFRSELDVWVRGRRPDGAAEADPADVPAPPAPAADAPAASEFQTATPASPVDRAPRGPSRRRILQLGALGVATVGVVGWRLEPWRDDMAELLADAVPLPLTNFGGISQAAAISRDGRDVAFLSDRGGRMAVWVTTIGSEEFYLRSGDSDRELVNPDVRTLGFTTDGAHVTYWAKGAGGKEDIDTWAVAVWGGEPRRDLGGRVAEYDWCAIDQRLVYHRPEDGDPTFVRAVPGTSDDLLVHQAPDQQHSHFPTWSPDCAFIYFVQGSPGGPGEARMDIWRVPARGGPAERLTDHDTYVAYPVFIDNRTLLYVADDSTGGGPFIHSLDVRRGGTRRLVVNRGIERVTSLAASANGTRLVMTLARWTGSLWRLPVGVDPTSPERLTLTTGNGSSPRFIGESLLYVASQGSSDTIWMLMGEAATQLWTASEARIVGGPAISRDGRLMAVVVRHGDRTALRVGRVDGTDVQTVPTSIVPDGDPAWAPDGTLTIGGLVDGVRGLFSVDVASGRTGVLVRGNARDPVWSPDGTFVAYSGADVGTTFPLRAATPDGRPHRVPPLMLTRGARRLAFLPRASRTLLVLRGEIRHKNVYTFDLDTGREEALTEFPGGFDVRSFDISPDGQSLVVEQFQERSEIALIER